jgi:hypothetical protein
MVTGLEIAAIIAGLTALAGTTAFKNWRDDKHQASEADKARDYDREVREAQRQETALLLQQQKRALTKDKAEQKAEERRQDTKAKVQRAKSLEEAFIMGGTNNLSAQFEQAAARRARMAEILANAARR